MWSHPCPTPEDIVEEYRIPHPGDGLTRTRSQLLDLDPALSLIIQQERDIKWPNVCQGCTLLLAPCYR